MTDNTGFSIAQLFNPETIRQYLAEQEATVQQVQQTQAPQPPAIDVPVRYVPPPVTLHGRLKVRASFDYDSLVGLSYEQIKQRVYEAIEGRGQGEDWLPVVRLFDIELWQEEVKDEPAQRPGSLAAAVDATGRVQEAGHRSLPADAAGPGFGVQHHGPEQDAGIGNHRHADGDGGGVEPAPDGPVPGPEGDGDYGGQEPGAGGPGGEPAVG